MNSILFADDDILTLNRLTALLDWNAHGYEIVGQACGGNDCLKLLEKLSPDILILDIDMPDKNGVEVIREIQRRKLSVKVLILSNYDTFSFVRDAMRCGACDYLLKHQLSEAVLLEKLSEMKEMMEKEGISTSHLSWFTTVAKQQYLAGLLKGGVTNPEEHAHMLTQKDFSCKNNCLALLQITNFILITHFSPNMEREKMIDSILTLSTNIFAKLDNGLITYLEYGRFAVLFHYDDQTGAQEILNRTLQGMRLLSANIRKLFGLTVLYELSPVFSDTGTLPSVYEKTLALLEKKPFSPDSEKTAGDFLSIQEEKELMDALTTLDLPQTRQILKRIFDREHMEIPSQPLIHQLLQIGVRFQLNQKMELLKDYDEEIRGADLAQMPSQAVRQFLTDYFSKIIGHAPGYGVRRYSPHIQKALLYIQENYAKDLSLNALADWLHLSPTHLSRLFRQELDTSFIEYLVSYRIQRARQLIRSTDLDLKTIGERVGFHGYNYFLRAYKEKTGHTPTQDVRHHKN